MEDNLSERVLRRLLHERPVPFAVGPVRGRGGFGYLKKQAPAFNNLAKHCPVLMLTDLDRHPCAPGLLGDWLKKPSEKHPNFLLRVAVREVEAWILASDAALGRFLGLRKSPEFPSPENLNDPKHCLLALAEKAPRRDLRDAIVRRDSPVRLRQGPAYNSTLGEFVERQWDTETAAVKCPSLRGLLKALSRLEFNWSSRGD